MVGFLNTILGADDNTPARPSKADFPFRDGFDPRVLYVLSQRAKRISLKVKPGSREVHVVVPGLRAFPKAHEFVRVSPVGCGAFLFGKRGLNWKRPAIIMRRSWINGSEKFLCGIRKAVGAAVSREMAKDIFLIVGA